MAFWITDGLLRKYEEEEGVTEVVIPEGVTSIGDLAFQHCDTLTSITIPESVTSIGHSAFERCRRLTSITIPESVTSIGNFAFLDCATLTSITIPESVKSIGGGAFSGCHELSDMILPKGIRKISAYTFHGCINLTHISIPKKVKNIGNGAFRFCNKLTSITIPDGVKSIGREAFQFCEKLSIIDLPESVTKIGSYAFQKNQSIRYHEHGFSCIIKLEHDWISPNDWTDVMKLNQTDPDYSDEIYAIRDIIHLHCFILSKNNFVRCVIFEDQWTSSYKVPLAILMMPRRDVSDFYYRSLPFCQVMDYIFEHDDVQMLAAITDTTYFCTNFFQENCNNKIIEAAIQHTQNGGSIEIQTILMRCKSEVTGYEEPRDMFKL